jgi:hypothetical protein
VKSKAYTAGNLANTVIGCPVVSTLEINFGGDSCQALLLMSSGPRDKFELGPVIEMDGPVWANILNMLTQQTPTITIVPGWKNMLANRVRIGNGVWPIMIWLQIG